MTIYELSDLMKTDIIWTRYSNQCKRHTAKFEYTEIKDDPILISTYGDGDTPAEALEHYVEKIRGKTLVVNAMSKTERKEFGVPETLTV